LSVEYTWLAYLAARTLRDEGLLSGDLAVFVVGYRAETLAEHFFDHPSVMPLKRSSRHDEARDSRDKDPANVEELAAAHRAYEAGSRDLRTRMLRCLEEHELADLREKNHTE
jgi:hypothetical protein